MNYHSCFRGPKGGYVLLIVLTANCVLVSDKANELLSETGQYRVIEHSKVETEVIDRVFHFQ